MTHRNAPLSVEGRHRLVQRCQTRPIAHVAAEMGISRACASKWVNRSRYGELGCWTGPRPRTISRPRPRRSCWPGSSSCGGRASGRRPDHARAGARWLSISTRTVGRVLQRLGLNRRRFLDPSGDSNRKPGLITARWPGHMVHLDVKKVGRIPDGGGWRVHGRDSDQAPRRRPGQDEGPGAAAGYVYLHSAVDGYSRLAYTEPLDDEKGATAAAFLARAKILFAAHGISHIHRVVTDNGACYRSADFARIRRGEDPAPAHQAVHATAQRQSRALPTDPDRGSPLRPRVHQRRAALPGHRRLEHPLQLPSTPQRRGRPTAGISAQDRRHQRHGLEHLGLNEMSTCCVRPPCQPDEAKAHVKSHFR